MDAMSTTLLLTPQLWLQEGSGTSLSGNVRLIYIYMLTPQTACSLHFFVFPTTRSALKACAAPLNFKSSRRSRSAVYDPYTPAALFYAEHANGEFFRAFLYCFLDDVISREHRALPYVVGPLWSGKFSKRCGVKRFRIQLSHRTHRVSSFPYRTPCDFIRAGSKSFLSAK